MAEMLSPEAKRALEDQKYRVVGGHSAVKTCGWTKNMLRGRGGCYKLKFYGIMSHQCLQMTTSMSCANRCVFCWRGYKAPVGKEWAWDVDEPGFIFEGSVAAQRSLLTGFGGHDEVLRKLFEEAQRPRHVALSLSGEPIVYPRINELLDRFNKEGISTFMVTNAQYPEAIKNLSPVTQLYVSLDAPSKELLKKIDVPLFSDYWERLNQSLTYLSLKHQRTCIRITAIKGLNMVEPEQYAKLIMKGNPDFVEVKSYMHVGASRKFLGQDNMPLHEEVVAFTKDILLHLPDYALVAEHIPSRVVMFAKKKYRFSNDDLELLDDGRSADAGSSEGDSADCSGDSADCSGDSADGSGDSADCSGDSADCSGDSADCSGDSADGSGDSADGSGNSADVAPILRSNLDVHSKKNLGWRTWIDFEKWHDLILSGRDFSSDDYSRETPASSIGLSGRGTPTKEESIAERTKQRERARKAASAEKSRDFSLEPKKSSGLQNPPVDEETAEMDFWKS